MPIRAQLLQEAQVREEGPASVSKLSPVARHFQSEWKEYSLIMTKLASAKGRNKAELNREASRKIENIKETYGVRKVSIPGKKRQETYLVSVFVDFTDGAVLDEAARHGLKVSTRLETICTGFAYPDSLDALAALTGIRRIEVSTNVKIKLDSARVETGVLKVHSGGESYGENGILKAYRGEGVVVGVVDVGFDYTHPTFYDPDNASVYRVKRVWDQRANTGAAPSGYDYGVEYATREKILSAQHCNGDGSHATHVAGIAGGSGAGTIYGGMAPKSDLVFVPTTMYTQGIFDGICYIKNYAESQKKPCVVNMSIGSHVGPHDGTSPFDRACDQLKSDGFVLVGSAGNEGQDPLYLAHTFTAKTKDTLMWSVIDFYDDQCPLDIWSDDASDFFVAFELWNQTEALDRMQYYYSSASGQQEEKTLKSGSNEVVLSFLSEHNPDNGKARVYIFMDASKKGDLRLLVQLKSRKTDQTMSVQMWLNSGEFSNEGFTDTRVKTGSTSHTIGEIGGTGNSVISVGASVSRTWWNALNGSTYGYPSQNPKGDIALFSSHGPTADNRMKPDVSAPGCAIISSYNSYDESRSSDDQMGVREVSHDGSTYRFGIMQGTSMASPATAGIIALWLQADSSLNVDKTKEILRNTSFKAYPGAGTSGIENTWGYGRIDALAGLKYILRYQNPDDPDNRDTVPPAIVRVATEDGMTEQVLVYFNEPVSKATAELMANYRIDGVTVSAAVYNADEKKVTLTTSGLKADEYTLVINGVEDIAGNSMKNVSMPFTFRYAQIPDVAGLCALRQTYVKGKKYQITGDMTVTAVIGKFGSQQSVTNAWIQDRNCVSTKGHSIMLYNVGDIFPTAVKEGDVLQGLAGELDLFEGVLQWKKFETDGLEFTGETASIVVDDATIRQLEIYSEEYQSAMVRVKKVSFAKAGHTFAVNTAYDLSDENDNNISLYTNREGDYLEQTIPGGKLNVTGYVGLHNGKCQLSLRKIADIEEVAVADPVFEPAPGSVVDSGSLITISCTTAKAKIYYTTNGTEPTTASTLYTVPVEIKENTVFKALAVKEGLENSKVVTASYTVKKPGVGTQSHILKGVKVYPNPNNGRFFVELPQKAEFSVFDLNGRMVQKEILQQGLHEMSLVVAGTYILRIASGKSTVSKRITVR